MFFILIYCDSTSLERKDNTQACLNGAIMRLNATVGNIGLPDAPQPDKRLNAEIKPRPGLLKSYGHPETGPVTLMVLNGPVGPAKMTFLLALYKEIHFYGCA
jgi:hypothetical protein